MNPTTYTIAFKIDAEPWADLGSENAIRGMALSVAFSDLLSDRIRAAIGGNASPAPQRKALVAPIRSGYLGKFDVLELECGLLAIQNLMTALHLSNYCEIVCKTADSSLYRHFSGPTNGPFEAYFSEMVQTKDTMVESLLKTQPQPRHYDL